MVHHQRPVVDAHRHVRDLLGVFGEHRQALDASAEVIAEPTDGAAAEGRAGNRLLVDAEPFAQQRKRVFAGRLAALAAAQLGEMIPAAVPIDKAYTTSLATRDDLT